jgi:hypothetical protein
MCPRGKPVSLKIAPIALVAMNAIQEQRRENASRGPEHQSGQLPIFEQQLQPRAGL